MNISNIGSTLGSANLQMPTTRMPSNIGTTEASPASKSLGLQSYLSLSMSHSVSIRMSERSYAASKIQAVAKQIINLKLLVALLELLLENSNEKQQAQDFLKQALQGLMTADVVNMIQQNMQAFQKELHETEISIQESSSFQSFSGGKLKEAMSNLDPIVMDTLKQSENLAISNNTDSNNLVGQMLDAQM